MPGRQPQLGPTNNPGGARWCDNHTRLECTANKSRDRGICHGPAVRGTDKCTTHSGVTRQVAMVKGEARINAWSAIGRAPDAGAIDSSAAVLGMLQQSWMRAHLYGALLQAQVERDGTDEAALEGGEAEKANGLIGYRFGAAGKDGNIYAVSEEARALVGLEAQERDRVVKYAKVAHDMGISERMTSMAERWGEQVVNRLVIILGGLNLTPEQEALVPALIQAHLGSIELGTGQ